MAGDERIGAHLRSQPAGTGSIVDGMLYRCVVGHTRLRPVRHRLRYTIFMLLIDLEQITALAARLRLFSYDRFNLISLHGADHGDGSATPLRQQVEAHLNQAGIAWDGGPIRMLFMPRVLGYAFNPLTVYYCYCRDGRLAAILYEVHNTFGQRHNYLLPIVPGAGAAIHQQVDKTFYVSPFMDMRMRYRFDLVAPAKTLRLCIAGEDDQGPIISTALHGVGEALSDRALLSAGLAMPLLGLKVMGGIHFEALKLWRKGIALRRRPPPPSAAVTLGAAAPPAAHHAGMRPPSP